MNLTCSLGRFRSPGDRPGTHFRLARRQIADQAEKMITCLYKFLQTGFFQSEIVEKHFLLIIVELGYLFLDLRTYDKYFAVFFFRIFTYSLNACI